MSSFCQSFLVFCKLIIALLSNFFMSKNNVGAWAKGKIYFGCYDFNSQIIIIRSCGLLFNNQIQSWKLILKKMENTYEKKLYTIMTG